MEPANTEDMSFYKAIVENYERDLADSRSALELQETMICTNEEALNAAFKAGKREAAEHILDLWDEAWPVAQVFIKRLKLYVEELK